MTDYAKLYALLFNAVTDAVEKLDAGDAESARQLLISVQLRTEQLYIDGEEPAGGG